VSEAVWPAITLPARHRPAGRPKADRRADGERGLAGENACSLAYGLVRWLRWLRDGNQFSYHNA